MGTPVKGSFDLQKDLTQRLRTIALEPFMALVAGKVDKGLRSRGHSMDQAPSV